MKWSVVVVVTVAFCHGCIDDNLVRCGDRSCPVTSTCMAGRCIDPQQVVACDAVAEGDGCTVLGTHGICRGGLCEIAGCGDGFVDGLEVCDDGNQLDGDGCSRSCDSDETCGNGVLDLAETCDCGTSADTQPLGCPTTNSDELTALCDTGCTRRCGDDTVTGLEACDGTMVPATCEDFGFYKGTVTCSPFCSFVRDCSGQCGDMVVDVSEGEVCDGDKTVVEACVEFGRDFGVLGCNEFCNPDVGGDCRFYDWSVLTETTGVVDLQANDHGYVANRAGTIVVSYDGVATNVQRTTSTRVFATADTFLLSDTTAAGPLELERFDPGVGWVALSSLAAEVTGPFQAIGDGAYLWVLDELTCSVDQLDVVTQTITKVAEPPVTGCVSFDVLDGKVVIATTDTIYWIDDIDGWTEVNSTADTVRWFGDHILTLKNGEREIIDRNSGANTPAVPLGDVIDVVTTRGGNDLSRTSTSAMIAHAGYLGGFITLPNGANTMKRDGAGRVIAWGDKNAYRLTATWSVPDTQQSFTEQPDGSVGHFTSSSVGTTAWSGGLGQPTSVVGDPDKPALVASSTGLYKLDTGTSAYVLESGLSGPSQLVASTAEIWAIVAGLPRLRVGTSWETKTLPPNCTSAIDMAAWQSRVLFLLVCPSTFGSRRIFEYSAGSWAQIGPLITGDSLVIARDDAAIFVVTQNTFRRLDNNQTSWSMVGATIEIGSFAARSATEVYYQRTQDNALYMWNGMEEIPFRQLSPLQTTVQQAVALEAGLYVKTSQGNAVLAWFGPKPTGL